jgi:hypothetical protein
MKKNKQIEVSSLVRTKKAQAEEPFQRVHVMMRAFLHWWKKGH